ncbi:G-protein coupled receptor 4-like [Cheilinus undulatus]|uniref:G-protein coupled receptor 4-like n=1 Tax=Cheilinus undulatus TaxID=241271 RepID=UPI001BD6442F|nr:G-protein coupled receptor 4-like [Cheilinus undulatus]
MEDFHINNSVESGNHDNYDITDYRTGHFVMHVLTCIIVSIGLPLTLMTIYALYTLVRKDHVTPIYAINLLISDLVQLCSMIVMETKPESDTFYETVFYIYHCGLVTSVAFMVCVSLERYLVIAQPIYYRFTRTIWVSVSVSVGMWLITPVYFLTVFPWVSFKVTETVFSAFLIIPFPLLIFFVVGTLRALSTCTSVLSEEKHRIVGIQVLVLLIYILLFLPSMIWPLVRETGFDKTLNHLSLMFVKLSPLADLVLYVFIRKETISKLLAALCCCKMENSDENVNTINVDEI